MHKLLTHESCISSMQTPQGKQIGNVHLPYAPPTTEATIRRMPLLSVVSTFWEKTMMTVRRRYKGLQVAMAGKFAERLRMTAMAAEQANQNLMPYCTSLLRLQPNIAHVRCKAEL